MDDNEDREAAKEYDIEETEITYVYNTFVEDNGQSDLTLLIEGRRVPVSKAVLCVASPVFRAMLQTDFKEKDQEEISLPGKRFKDFVEFLNCIYPDKMKHVTGKTVYGILPLASEYQVSTLQNRCEGILVALVKYVHRTNPKEIFRHIQLSETYKLKDLNRTSILLASELHFDDIEEANEEYTIEEESMKQLKDFALKRHELDNMDDKKVLSLPEASRSTVFSAIKRIIEKVENAQFRREVLRARRLYERYFPNDKNLTKVIKKTKMKLNEDEDDEDEYFLPADLPSMDIDEQMELLPELLKQKLTAEFEVDAVSKLFMHHYEN